MSEPHPVGLTGLGTDPDEVERRIAQWADGFAAKAERYRAAQEQIEQIRSTASSPDGAVRVTVRADGSITDLQFTERIRTMPLPDLSARILATMRSAQAKIVGQVGETMTEQLGDEDAQTRAAMMDELRTRFPEEEEEAVEEQVPDKWDYDEDQPSTPEPPQPPAPPRPPEPPRPPAGRDAPPRRRPSGDDDGFDSDFDPLRD